MSHKGRMPAVRRIVLDMQSGLYANAIRRILVQELDDCQVIISEAPDRTAQRCRLFQPYALLMEATGYSPWRVEERLAVCDEVKRDDPQCRVVLLVDDADRGRAESVKRAKKEGLIDAFIYSSVTDSYLAAMMDSL